VALKSPWIHWLAHPRMPWITALVAMALCLPALAVGWQLDDFSHRMILLRAPGVLVEPMQVFVTLPGDPEMNRRYMDVGILPWWTPPDYQLAFCRVLSAASMWLDYRLWPGSPVLMHAHSLLWLGAMVGFAALLYRRVLGAGWVAGLAALLYAVDEAHAMPAAWLANRNSLLATAFGLLALIAHVRWRRDGWRRGAAASAFCFALALLSAEAGLGALAYFAAWALVVEEGPWLRRVRSLIPAGAVFVGWAVFYRLAGFGAHGSGLYLDPGDGPAAYLAALGWRAPFLLLGQWSPVPAEISILVTGDALRIAWIAGWLCVALLGALFLPLLRRDRTARFWALGMLLSLLPVTGTFPANRLLTFAGVGAMGLLAQFLADRPWPRLGKAAAALLVVTHLVIAPLMLPFAAYGMKRFGEPMLAAAATVPSPPGIAEQDLVVVSSPDYLTFVTYIPTLKYLEGKPRPRRARGLLSGRVGAELSRPDPFTLRARLEGGLFEGYLGRLFRGEQLPLKPGDVVDLPRMRVEVAAVDREGQPTELLFRFPVPLEDRSLRWVAWSGRGFAPFTPPAVGETVRLAAPPGPVEVTMGAGRSD
jgi:hypothetical protein